MEDEYYIASHLLKEGFNGTIYQLDVLLWCMIKLLNKKHDFQAMVEVKDKGILDDIIIINDSKINKDNKKIIEAYQVKHYLNNFNLSHLYQDSSVIHIGKFFYGWLKIQAEYNKEEHYEIRSVLFSTVPFNEIMNVETPFFTRKKSATNNFIIKYKFSSDVHELEPITNIELNEKSNPIFTILADATQEYLHTPGIKKNWVYENKYSCKKDFLVDFRRFLESFHIRYQFDIQKKVIQGKDKVNALNRLEKETTKNLVFYITNLRKEPVLLKEKDYFIFLKDILERWFGDRKKTENSNKKEKLTASFLDKKISRILERPFYTELKSETIKIINKISNEIDGHTIINDNAIKQFKEVLSTKQLILVGGHTGTGKSGLIKSMLSEPEHSNYLLLRNKKLSSYKPQLMPRLRAIINEVKIISIFDVYDVSNASLLIDILKLILENDGKKLIIELRTDKVSYDYFSKELINTTDAQGNTKLQQLLLSPPIIRISPLPLHHILKEFPVLKPFKDFTALMNLIKNLKQLKHILNIIKQHDEHTLSALYKTEYELANFVINMLLGTVGDSRNKLRSIEKKFAKEIGLNNNFKKTNKFERSLNTAYPCYMTPLGSAGNEYKDLYELDIIDEKSNLSHKFLQTFSFVNYWNAKYADIKWDEHGRTIFWEKFSKNRAMVNKEFIHFFMRWVMLYAESLFYGQDGNRFRYLHNNIDASKGLKVYNPPFYWCIFITLLLAKQENIIPLLLQMTAKDNISEQSIFDLMFNVTIPIFVMTNNLMQPILIINPINILTNDLIKACRTGDLDEIKEQLLAHKITPDDNKIFSIPAKELADLNNNNIRKNQAEIHIITLSQKNYIALIEHLMTTRPPHWECFALLKQQAEVVYIKSLEVIAHISKEIIDASSNGGFEKIHQLLNEISTNCKNDIIFRLAELKNFTDNHLHAIELLIESNANINYKHPQIKATALHIAAANNNISLIEKLLDSHADIEAKNQDGATPLIVCANKENNSQAVHTLIKYRANLYANINISGKTTACFTALHTAAKANCIENVKILIQNGANPNKSDFIGRTPKQLTPNREIITILNRAEKDFVCPSSDYYANLQRATNPIGKLIRDNDIVEIKILIANNQFTQGQIEIGVITAIDEIYEPALSIFNALLPQEIFKKILQKNLAEFTKKSIEINKEIEKKLALIVNISNNPHQSYAQALANFKANYPVEPEFNLLTGDWADQATASLDRALYLDRKEYVEQMKYNYEGIVEEHKRKINESITKKQAQLEVNETKVALIKKYLANSVHHVPSTISLFKSSDSIKTNATSEKRTLPSVPNNFI